MKNNIKKINTHILIYTIFSVITGLVGVVLFQIYGLITETVQSSNMDAAYQITIYTMLVIATLFILDIIGIFVKRNIIYKFSKKLREDIIRKFFSTSFSEARKLKERNLLSVIINDVEKLESLFLEAYLNIINSLSMFLIMLVAIGRINIRYVFLVLILLIPSVIQKFIFRKVINDSGQKTAKGLGVLTEKTLEYSEGIELIKTYNKDDVFINKYITDVKNYEDIRLYEERWKATNNTFILLAVYIVKVVSLLFFVNDSINGILLLSLATVLFGYVNNIGEPLSKILINLSMIDSTKKIRGEINQILEKNIKNKDSVGTDFEFNKQITFNNLSFSYGNNEVLNNFNYRFEKGKKYIIFGESGSGKSTFLKVLMGYEEDYEGKVLIDDTELKELNIEKFWDKIAFIDQNVFVMNGNLKDNITLFNEDIPDESVEKAVGISGLSELVKSFERGIYEPVKEGGSNLSGGEKQRISIARAIVMDKEILIMDEALSALDNIKALEVEQKLLESDRTIFSISHRVNHLIREYDEILFLKNGKVNESGSYEELLNNNSHGLEKLKFENNGDKHE
ncbi:ABC transporter ATP-binding protein [Microaceticoccus formicicus]|uniref:ABC transporter ATP-binding protein n=1 Tax=Microaceticoccus formicicus TaxID=3118105 RepID=UPI003CD02A53|nr:ABC transporter ATP-binding protein [Peptoniphilaceae bacterium AMB_02]